MSTNLEKQNRRLRNITIRLDHKIKCLLEENQRLQTVQSRRPGSKQEDNDDFGRKLEKQAIELNTLKSQNKQLRAKIEKLSVNTEALLQDNAKLKKQIYIQEKALQSDDGKDQKLNPHELQKHIKRLELALVKAREEALSKEIKASTTFEDLTKKNTYLEKERVKLSKLNHDQNILQDANKKLKTSLDGLHGSEEKIEFLTLKNVELQSENTKLRRNVDELNELEAVNQQLIENHDLNQKELMDEIENLRKTVSLKQIQIQDMKQKIQRLGRIVIRQNIKSTYRDSIVTTKDQNSEEDCIKVVQVSHELIDQYRNTILSLFPIQDTEKINILSELKGLKFLTSTLAHNYFDHVQTLKYDASFKKDVEYAVKLNRASALISCIFHVCEYKKSAISPETKAVISNYLSDFKNKYDQKLFDFHISIDDAIADEALKSRELTIFELSDALFLTTITKGIFKAMNKPKFISFAEKISGIENLISEQIEKLMTLRKLGLGIEKSTDNNSDAFKKFRQFIGDVCDIFVNYTLDDTEIFPDDEIIQGTTKNLQDDIKSCNIEDDNYLAVYLEAAKSASVNEQQEPLSPNKLNRFESDDDVNDKLRLKIHLLDSKLANLREVEKQHEKTSGELVKQIQRTEVLSANLDKAEGRKEELELEVKKLKKILKAVGLDSCSSDYIERKEQIQAELSDANNSLLKSQISKQRDLIGKLAKSAGKRESVNMSDFSNLNWLKEDLVQTFTDFQTKSPHRVILNRLFSMENKFDVAPLDEQSNGEVLKYYAAHMGEQILGYLTEQIS